MTDPYEIAARIADARNEALIREVEAHRTGSGRTAQGGHFGDVEGAKMTEDPGPSDRDYAPCAACGRLTHIDDIDSKPENLADFEKPRTWRDWLVRIFRPRRWRLDALSRAADESAQFERLECGACYGPGYVSLRTK